MTAGHLQNLDRRFPDRALTIRRLIRDDPSFKELCADYSDALAALAYWQSSPQRSAKQIEDYRELLAELDAKIEAALNG